MPDHFEYTPRQNSRRHLLRDMLGEPTSTPAQAEITSPIRHTRKGGRYHSLTTSAAPQSAPLPDLKAIIAAANQGQLDQKQLGSPLPTPAHAGIAPVPDTPRQKASHRSGAGAVHDTEDRAALAAMIVTMILSQVSDPVAQDHAIAMALACAGNIRTVTELAQFVAGIKLAEGAPLNDTERAGDHAGHYREDGTWVEVGSPGYTTSSNNSGAFMSSAHSIFYNADGSAKTYEQAWNGWSRRFGRGILEGTHTSSKNLFDGMELGRQSSSDPAVQEKIGTLWAASRDHKFVSREGKEFELKKEQAVGCYAGESGKSSKGDDARSRECLESAIKEGHGDVSDPRNKKALDDTLSDKGSIGSFLKKHSDASPATNRQAQTQAPSPK